jgi:membrane fusion protein (multidrug efflux system)
MPQPVKVGSAVDDQWIVLEGLKPGDQVMVDGFQKLRPGVVVKPVPWQAAASGPSQRASGPPPNGAPVARASASGPAAAASTR